MASVVDIDKGWKDINAEMRRLNNVVIKIGFQEGQLTNPEVKGTRVKQGGQSMPQIAADNEYGTDKIPARPFMSTSFDNNKKKISTLVKQQISEVQAQLKTSQQALDAIGTVVVGMVQDQIDQIYTPPNAPLTIRIKGSSKPLIDFGQMRQSVSYAIEKRR